MAFQVLNLGREVGHFFGLRGQLCLQFFYFLIHVFVLMIFGLKLQVQRFGCQHLVIFIVQADCTCICRHTHDTCLKYFGTGCYPYTVHLLHVFDNETEAASFQEPGFHFA